jgi:hypothetical protein
VVTAQAILDLDPNKDNIIRGDVQRRTAQKRLAAALMREAGLTDHKDPCGIAEYEKVQAVRPGYQLKIVEARNLKELIFKGIFTNACFFLFKVNLVNFCLGPPADKVINLLLHDRHFYVITRMPGLLGVHYWCDECNKGYDHREDHKCERGECPCCNGSPDCPPVDFVKCDDCNRWFKGPACFHNHKINEKVHPDGKKE